MSTQSKLPARAILLTPVLLAAATLRPTAAVEIIAHRGASHSAPENTLAAVELAWQRGADAVEFDVWLTADGRIVALHDETTERTTEKNWNVAKKTYSQLRSLDAGSWKHPAWAGEKIPSLEELVATVPDGKRVFIEIKDKARLVPELERVLKASGKRPEQTVVISFDFAAVQAAKKRMPELAVYWIQGTSPNRDKRTGKLSASPAELIQKCHEAGLDGLDLKYDSRLTREIVSEMHRLGLELYVWTVNSPDDARRMVALGVDGITTDRPGWLREQLTSTGGR